MLSYSISENKDPTKVLVEVMVEKADEYYLYFLINSVLVKGSPIRLDV